MVILWRGLLIVSLTMVGLAAGAFIGGHFLTSSGQGLAGAFTALGYGLLGGLGLLTVAIFLAIKLPVIKLRNYALACTLLASIIYATLVYRAMAKSVANREPDAAFIPAGNFTAMMERLDTSDPYLFVKMEIDSTSRSWRMTGPAPQQQICSSQITAKYLLNMRTALDKLAATDLENLQHCQNSNPAIKRLSWSAEGSYHSLDISTGCVQNNYLVGRALAIIEGMSHASTSQVICN